jgi:hypothetical protein
MKTIPFVFFLLIPVLALFIGITSAGDGKKLKKPQHSSSMKPIGKTQAPVEISASLKGGVAKVNITFLRDASEVEISYNGLDGMELIYIPFSSSTQYDKGETVQTEINYYAPAGRSYLSIHLSGNFGGTKENKVQAFAVGKLSTQQKHRKSERLTTDNDGRLEYLMPLTPITK